MSLLRFLACLLTVLSTPIFAQDTRPPSLRLSQPRMRQEFNDDSFSTNGLPLVCHVTDNNGVADISILLNGDLNPSPFYDGSTDLVSDLLAIGFMPQPGTNTMYIWATDYDGNRSKPVYREFFYQVPANVMINSNGNGFAVGPAETVPTYIGRGYRFVARPMRGNLFDYWSDDSTGKILSSNTVLNLILPTSDVSITANFVTNMFAKMQGTYRGLCTGMAQHNDSDPYSYNGLVNITTTSRGAYSGKLWFGLGVYPFSGKFTDNGDNTASSSASLTVASNINVNIALTIAIDTSVRPAHIGLFGSSDVNRTLILDDEGNMDIFTAHGDFSGEMLKPIKKTTAARYSYAFGPVTPDNEQNGMSGPGGYSYGAMVLDNHGHLGANVHMADNVPATFFSADLDIHGNFPFYVPLYAPSSNLTNLHGCITGYFTNLLNTRTVLAGNVQWIKPKFPQRFDSHGNPISMYYQDGFNANVSYRASRYIPPNSRQNVFQWTSGVIKFDSVFKNRVSYEPKTNAFAIFDGNPLSISLALLKPTGTISGVFTNNGTRVAFNGEVLPKSFKSPVSPVFTDSPSPAAFGFLLYQYQSYSVYVGQ